MEVDLGLFTSVRWIFAIPAVFLIVRDQTQSTDADTARTHYHALMYLRLLVADFVHQPTTPDLQCHLNLSIFWYCQIYFL